MNLIARRRLTDHHTEPTEVGVSFLTTGDDDRAGLTFRELASHAG